jgi:hypothetical protein
MEPFPGLVGVKSTKEEKPCHFTITPIRLQAGCYPLQVSPRILAQYKAGSLYGKKSTEARSTDDRSLRAESERSPNSIRPTRRSGKRPNRIFPRQAFTSNRSARSHQNTSRRNAPRTHARNTPRSPASQSKPRIPSIIKQQKYG